MKKFYFHCKEQLKNYSLYRKIILILFFIVAILFIASVISTQVVTHSSNKLLYQALSGSLRYSAEDISRKLSNVESMTNAIISNQYIRKSLISITDTPFSTVTLQNADSNIRSSLADYYQNYKDNEINYINLYYGNHVSSSFNADSTVLPEGLYETVISAAKQNSGYPCWITDYCNSRGLYLARDCRRVENLKLETLGTVVVNVDMDKLIQASTKSILQDSVVQYVIFQDEQEIYHSSGIDTSYIPSIDKQLTSSYSILSLGKERFFCTRGTIENNDWTYICLVPYSDVEHTLMVTQFVSLLILSITVIAAILISRFMILSITNDFGQLVDKMKLFAKNESKLPVSHSDYTNRTDEAGILHRQFDEMTVEIQRLIQQNYINELLSKDARLKALESQINPHFLYNALESINWRAKSIGATDISDMVKSLGDLLRATLSNKENTCTIQHELQIVHDYMTIQKIRFDKNRLTYEESVSPEILYVYLPQMTIQPLIDNAINYAMEVITETCHITLTGYLENGIVHILITNNGSQFEDFLLEKLENGTIKPHGIGIGLLNIQKRIQLTYGNSYGLRCYNSDEEHAVAEILIPQNRTQIC